MTTEYEDLVRNLTNTYWQSLLKYDAVARAETAAQAQAMGFKPEAAETIINTFSRGPLEEWLTHQSGL